MGVHRPSCWVLCGYLCWLVARPPRARAATTRLLSARYLPLVGVVSGVFRVCFTVGGGWWPRQCWCAALAIARRRHWGWRWRWWYRGSLIALSAYVSAGQVSWSLGCPGAGRLSTISWGVACARRLPERWLRSVFIGFLLVTTALMWPG